MSSTRRGRRRKRRDHSPRKRQTSIFTVWDENASEEQREKIQREQELNERLHRSQAGVLTDTGDISMPYVQPVGVSHDPGMAMSGAKDVGRPTCCTCTWPNCIPCFAFLNVFMWISLIACIVIYVNLAQHMTSFIAFFVFYAAYLLMALFDRTLHYMNHVVGEADALTLLKEWTEMVPRPWLLVNCYHTVTRRTKDGTKRVHVTTFQQKFWLECSAEDKSVSLDMSLTAHPLVRLHATFGMFFASMESASLHQQMIDELYNANRHRDRHCVVLQGVEYDTGGSNVRLVVRSANERPWWLHRPVFFLFVLLGFGSLFVFMFSRASVDFPVTIQKGVVIDRMTMEDVDEEAKNFVYKRPQQDPKIRRRIFYAFIATAVVMLAIFGIVLGAAM